MPHILNIQFSSTSQELLWQISLNVAPLWLMLTAVTSSWDLGLTYSSAAHNSYKNLGNFWWHQWILGRAIVSPQGDQLDSPHKGTVIRKASVWCHDVITEWWAELETKASSSVRHQNLRTGRTTFYTRLCKSISRIFKILIRTSNFFPLSHDDEWLDYAKCLWFCTKQWPWYHSTTNFSASVDIK